MACYHASSTSDDVGVEHLGLLAPLAPLALTASNILRKSCPEDMCFDPKWRVIASHCVPVHRQVVYIRAVSIRGSINF